MAHYASRYNKPVDHTVFLVGQDNLGHYCVQENHGLIGGEFINRAEALRFAQDESRSIPGSLVLITPAIIHSSPVVH